MRIFVCVHVLVFVFVFAFVFQKKKKGEFSLLHISHKYTYLTSER